MADEIAHALDDSGPDELPPKCICGADVMMFLACEHERPAALKAALTAATERAERAEAKLEALERAVDILLRTRITGPELEAAYDKLREVRR